MAMLPGNNDDVLARLMRAVVEDPPAGARRSWPCNMCDGRARGRRPAGGRRPRLVAGAAPRGLLLVARAPCWPPCGWGADVHRRCATGHIVLAVAVVNLLVAVGLSDFDPQIALNIFDAML
ncbi:unnamed protein product [Miscanthus lutarioriparius]|uniref:Uncharacterized protein n=1 Tax=Miscanthus lutarioriparius TaxID=422564 RepID=A0A811P348_9POAL|nr:unnamed protein product [Miscanthus lutarioriparius]